MTNGELVTLVILWGMILLNLVSTGLNLWSTYGHRRERERHLWFVDTENAALRELLKDMGVAVTVTATPSGLEIVSRPITEPAPRETVQ